MEVFYSWQVIAMLGFALVLGGVFAVLCGKLSSEPYQRKWRAALAVEFLLCMSADFGLGYPWQMNILFAFVIACVAFVAAAIVVKLLLRIIK